MTEGSTIPLALAFLSLSDNEPRLNDDEWQRVFDTIQFLVEKGADVNTRSSRKQDPEFLGCTILHRIFGAGEVVQYLVDNGADINAKDDAEMTPLHSAAYINVIGPAELFIEAGADLNAKNNMGKTPLDLARSDEMKALLIRSSKASKSPQASIPETNAKGSGCVGVLAIVGAVVTTILSITQE